MQLAVSYAASAIVAFLIAVLQFAGIVFAVVRWRRHPRTSQLLTLGLSLHLLSRGAMFVGQLMLVRAQSAATLPASISVLAAVTGIMALVGWGLVLLAVFSHRSEAETVSYVDSRMPAETGNPYQSP